MELLIVVVIIGILAAIAIPIFLNVQNAAYDTALKSDLRNAGLAMETTKITSADKKYDSSNLQLSFSNKAALAGVASNNIMICSAKDGSGFAITAKSISGNSITYKSNGFIQEGVTWTGSYMTLCPNSGFPVATSDYIWIYQGDVWKPGVR